MMKLGLIFVLFFITACSNLTMIGNHLPPQEKKVRLFKVENSAKSSLLSIQFMPHQWRWVQTDPLGAPITRMILTKEGWQYDGFITRNSQAKNLFSALSNALNPNNLLFKLDDNWKIEKNIPHFLIISPDGNEWKIEELEE